MVTHILVQQQKKKKKKKHLWSFNIIDEKENSIFYDICAKRKLRKHVSSPCRAQKLK
jgi:hypothetical protein